MGAGGCFSSTGNLVATGDMARKKSTSWDFLKPEESIDALNRWGPVGPWMGFWSKSKLKAPCSIDFGVGSSSGVEMVVTLSSPNCDQNAR
jgi:hypothetical protein